MGEAAFIDWFGAELAGLPGVLAVTLGGSRAAGTASAGSDWDFAIYYRRSFDPSFLRNKGWPGDVSEVGGWGGGVMNGGAWLTLGERCVDVIYRDLDQVEHWVEQARAGRFAKELLLFYVAGIPTYVLVAELATHLVLSGDLPRPRYPARLAAAASRLWLADARASLWYAAAALERRGDVPLGLANASRGLIEAAHSRLAARREWVLNEKGIVARAGLGALAEPLLAAADRPALAAAVNSIRSELDLNSWPHGPAGQ
jgi:hypothetical protein